MFMPCHQNEGKNHPVNTANTSFGSATTFKHLGTKNLTADYIQGTFKMCGMFVYLLFCMSLNLSPPH